LKRTAFPIPAASLLCCWYVDTVEYQGDRLAVLAADDHESVAVVFVLVPSLHRLGESEQARFAEIVFPRVFRPASILSVT
jgi:hypothetical protein